MKDDLKSKFFQELVTYEAFAAQSALEDETYSALIASLLRIDTSKPNVDIEYAKLRGSIEALQSLKATRNRLIEVARSRKSNS